MKKVLFALGIAISSLTTVQAQDIKYGIKAGPQLSNFIESDANNKTVITAFGGGYMNIPLSRKFFLQPELLYSLQGAKSSTDFPAPIGIDKLDYDEHIKLNYLYVPIMLQYAVSKHIRVEFGSQLGILLKAELEQEVITVSSIGTLKDKITLDIKDDAKSIDLGVNIGGVYVLDNGLNLTLRYSLGLTTIGEGDKIDSSIDTLFFDLPESKNSVLSLGVGYTF